MKKTILTLIFGCFLILALVFAFKFDKSSASGLGKPGDRCESRSDCQENLDCFYNTCLAKPFTLCNTWGDCAGNATHLMGCFDKGDGKKCYGRHAYPCGDRRDDPVCAPNFHCDISNPDYHYCESDKENELMVDLKANNSDGPLYLYFKDIVNLSWISENTVSCQASRDWSGSKSLSGSETIQLNQVKTYKFTLTCKNASGTQTATDSVQVIVRPKPPAVITKPAIVTR